MRGCERLSERLGVRFGEMLDRKLCERFRARSVEKLDEMLVGGENWWEFYDFGGEMKSVQNWLKW